MTLRKEWLWSLLELVLGLAPWIVGYRVAIWMMAKPMSELPASVQLPNCPAFRYDHAAYFCEPFGTTQSHPAIFVAIVIGVAVSFSLAVYIHFSGRAGDLSFTERIIAAEKARLA